MNHRQTSKYLSLRWQTEYERAMKVFLFDYFVFDRCNKHEKYCSSITDHYIDAIDDGRRKASHSINRRLLSNELNNIHTSDRLW